MIAGLRLSGGLQVLRYEPKQAYVAHSDYFETHTSSDFNWDPMNGGSNRFATVFLYLSDVEDGTAHDCGPAWLCLTYCHVDFWTPRLMCVWCRGSDGVPSRDVRRPCVQQHRGVHPSFGFAGTTHHCRLLQVPSDVERLFPDKSAWEYELTQRCHSSLAVRRPLGCGKWLRDQS